jgi:DNA adenine methylase
VAVVAEQRYPSPLRYPGGKGKLANYLKLVFLQNELVGCEYVEPYAGGAAVALHLLFEDYASHIHINDLNRSVHAFWKATLDAPDELCDRIGSTAVDVDEWQRQRAIQDDPQADEIDLAFSTFFLNRTSRSGIIGGGVIGGLDQTGKWKIDARFGRDDLIRRIRKIARHRSRITVTGLDAKQYLATTLPQVDTPFVYLDPPYYIKGGDLYQNSYSPDDHAAIAQLVQKLEVPWIVSYDAVPAIDSLYTPARRIAYGLSYSAQERYRGHEAMFFSDDLLLPDIESPANVGWRIVEEAQRAA